jgi:hypothetical protein
MAQPGPAIHLLGRFRRGFGNSVLFAAGEERRREPRG